MHQGTQATDKNNKCNDGPALKKKTISECEAIIFYLLMNVVQCDPLLLPRVFSVIKKESCYTIHLLLNFFFYFLKFYFSIFHYLFTSHIRCRAIYCFYRKNVLALFLHFIHSPFLNIVYHLPFWLLSGFKRFNSNKISSSSASACLYLNTQKQ